MALTLGPEIKEKYGTEMFVGRSDSLVFQQYTFTFGIFSGTPPATATAFLTAYGNYPYDSSQCLIYWNKTAGPTYYNIVDNELKLNNNFLNPMYPQRAGTASWFAVWRWNGATKLNVVIGEIGTLGSGKELEMNDLEIERTSGVLYSFPGDVRLEAPYPI